MSKIQSIKKIYILKKSYEEKFDISTKTFKLIIFHGEDNNEKHIF